MTKVQLSLAIARWKEELAVAEAYNDKRRVKYAQKQIKELEVRYVAVGGKLPVS